MANIAISIMLLFLHIMLGAITVKAAVNRCYFSLASAPFIAGFSVAGIAYCIKMHAETYVKNELLGKALFYIEKGFMYMSIISAICIFLIVAILAITTLLIDIIRERKERHETKMRYYISDLHFYHNNMLDKMDKRGFETLDDMHAYMIKQWNSKVKKGDEVVILGDLSMGNGQQTNELLRKLNGKKYLITGNHDHKFLGDKNFDRALLRSIKDYAEMRDGGNKVILSHYPMPFYNGQYRKDANGLPTTYMLHGHIHDTQDTRLLAQFEKMFDVFTYDNEKTGQVDKIPVNIINCFCMFSDYIPLTLEEWVENTKARMLSNH